MVFEYPGETAERDRWLAMRSSSGRRPDFGLVPTDITSSQILGQAKMALERSVSLKRCITVSQNPAVERAFI